MKVKFTLKKNAPNSVSIAHGDFMRTIIRGEQDYWECTQKEWEKIVYPTRHFEPIDRHLKRRKNKTKKEG